MPFSRQSLSDLTTQTAQDISSSVQGADPLLRFANLGIIGKVLARLVNLLYGYVDWIAQQAVPFTATEEFLEGWAGLKGVTRKAAVAAKGQATFSGTNGTLVPAGTSIVRGDGIEYTTDADATVASGSVVVSMTAVVPAAAGTLTVGQAVALGSAIAGVQSSGSVTASTTAGADVETDDSLRSRMLKQYAAPPQGGDRADYVSWALAVPGVTRAWVNPNGQGPGTVVVYFMMDSAESAHGGFPQGSNGVAAQETRDTAATGDQLTVANAVFTEQPVTALAYACAPTNNAVNFTLSGTSGWSSTTKTAVQTAISNVFLELGSPGGVYVPSGGVPAGQIDLSDITAAIDAVAGTEGYVLASPTSNITSSTGALPTLGTITFNP